MFRLGTTSYIIPADILPNVEFLAPQVDDVQLVLFETDEYGSNLPDAAVRQRLLQLAADHGLTYTVHLPLDLAFGSDGEALHLSLVKARRVIEATQDLNPVAYTLHLDGRPLLADGGCEPEQVAAWQANACRALETVSGWVSDPALLCIENLERWDPEAFTPVLARVPVSRTIDVGHLWLQGVDPMPHLRRWGPRTRVVHLHGIDGRDHKSLAHVAAAEVRPIVRWLETEFSGVLTLEVFNEPDLQSSLAVLNTMLTVPYRKAVT